MNLLLILVLLLRVPDVKVLKQDNISYVCFEPAAAQALLEMRIDYDTVRVKNEKLERLNVLADMEVERLQKQVDDFYLDLAEQSEMIAAMETAANQEKKWYKDPVICGFIGAMAGMAAGLAVSQIGH